MDLHLSTFRFDVTPPLGHPLCGGWIQPVVGVDDSLEAIGLVVLGSGAPIVICAVDWTGISNSAHLEWRKALAEAAHTTPERVAVQSVHQHNAPFVCLEAERIVSEQGDLPHNVDLGFFRQCLERGTRAIEESLRRAERITRIARAESPVERVASNRRILGPDGKVKEWRGSSTKIKLHHDLPEGLIDPMLKTVAFYSGDKRIAACHYYAVHPMSYYGDGRVTADFVGVARKRLQKEDLACAQIYFTGCAGNIAAGKYNDGSKPVRALLADRIYKAMATSQLKLKSAPIQKAEWRTTEILPTARRTLDLVALERMIAKKGAPVVQRNRPAFMVSWLRRLEQKMPIVLSALDCGDVALMHLPAECFIEYQLRSQAGFPKRFIATAAYGDGGPWYIPIESAYPQGGYEVDVAFSDPTIDPMLAAGIKSILA